MKIGVSGLFLKPTQVGGAEFVLRGLLSGLAQIPDVQTLLFLPSDTVEWSQDLNQGDRLTTIPVKIHGNRFLSEIWKIPQLAKQLRLDGLIYPNYFTPPRWRRSLPTVTIIHDLNYAHFPDLFSWKKRLWLNLTHRLTLANADVTVTVSEFVKRDVERVYRSNATVLSIPNAIDWQRFTVETAPKIPISQPFILSVANHYQHKNLRSLVTAFCQLPNNLNLVLVGQLPESLLGMRRDRCDDIPALIKELQLESRVFVTGHISDATLTWYYRHAALLVYPSLFEGFGMPPVEALGLGLPVLTTRCTAIPEATLNLAEYVDDPLDANELAQRILQLLQARSPRPSEATIARIRETYAPKTIAQTFVTLLTQHQCQTHHPPAKF